MKYVLHNLEETQKAAEDFVLQLSRDIVQSSDKAVVIGLYGDLGAGKTTFTQSVAQSFGLSDTIVSPTFVIEKIYELTGQKFTHLIHIDAYRLEKSEELLRLGWQEIISDPNNLIIIEWPERVADIMPAHLRLNFVHISETVRELEIIPM